MDWLPAIFLFMLMFIISGSDCRFHGDDVIKLPSDNVLPNNSGKNKSSGTRWAVLVAGSSGYWNYRHQADVCHAYQVLRKGGLKEENIIVFMYDDIAYNENNPRPGVIINHPEGGDVYVGVPKDYVGNNVTVGNFLAVLLGNRSALIGGSGKVLQSGPSDHIFIFYSDHGGPGILGMPTYPFLYANDLVDVLKRMHASRSYQSMAFYLEACESGSIFEGLLPTGLNIYATTAANAVENSWGTYCPGEYPGPPSEFETCLGDLYSVSWMEDSDAHNLQTESLKQQYNLVKARTSKDNTYNLGSHVMQYGDVELSKDHLFLYMGTNPANNNSTFVEDNNLPSFWKPVNQRDADLVYFWNKFKQASEDSPRKSEAQRQLLDVISHRLHVDKSIQLIGKLLFGADKGSRVLNAVRPAGQPLVDDWSCLKAMVHHFETFCGPLLQYGMKHMRSIANICNAGVEEDLMTIAARDACDRISNTVNSFDLGVSA